jgi:hypothetical protein
MVASSILGRKKKLRTLLQCEVGFQLLLDEVFTHEWFMLLAHTLHQCLHEGRGAYHLLVAYLLREMGCSSTWNLAGGAFLLLKMNTEKCEHNFLYTKSHLERSPSKYSLFRKKNVATSLTIMETKTKRRRTNPANP